MGPGQHPDACALTCTARTTTSSSLVVVPSTLTVAAPLVTIKCTTHKRGTSAMQRSFFSFEIIVVNSELTISFFTETFSKWPPPTTTTSLPLFPSSRAQIFWVWEQKMGDYLKSQHLWHITTGAPCNLHSPTYSRLVSGS